MGVPQAGGDSAFRARVRFGMKTKKMPGAIPAGERRRVPLFGGRAARRQALWLASLVGLATLQAGAGRPQVQNTSPAAELAGKARALDLRGRYELARQTWEQVLQLDPENAEALGGVVHCLRAEGQQAAAQQFLDRARTAHPGKPWPGGANGRQQR